MFAKGNQPHVHKISSSDIPVDSQRSELSDKEQMKKQIEYMKDQRRKKLQEINNGRPFRKFFLDETGGEEDVQDFNPNFRDVKLKGYGIAYSHPRHLNNYYNENIKSFKDMDDVLDRHNLIRVNDNDEGRTLNIGNKLSKEQLDVIKEQFESHNEPVRVGITSISRKYYKNFNDFYNAYLNHSGKSVDDVGNKEFESHTQRLAR